MLTSRIIPCLDVRDNIVVKGVQFGNLRELGSPAELAARYEQDGADEIVVLDITATNSRQKTQLKTVEEVRSAISIPLTVGGGIRSLDDIERLTDAGADRVSINTAAFAEPAIIRQCSERFGQQCTVVAIDARSNGSSWNVCTHAGTKLTGTDVIDWAKRVEQLRCGEILLTSFDRDGTRSGYDCKLLAAVANAVRIPVIASGGADNAGDLHDGLNVGAAAVLIASIIHDGDTTVTQLKRELAAMGATVRL